MKTPKRKPKPAAKVAKVAKGTKPKPKRKPYWVKRAPVPKPKTPRQIKATRLAVAKENKVRRRSLQRLNKTFVLKMPEEFYYRLKGLADDDGRTMTGEILRRLERSFSLGDAVQDKLILMIQDIMEIKADIEYLVGMKQLLARVLQNQGETLEPESATRRSMPHRKKKA